MLGQLLLYALTFALFVVIGTFGYAVMDTVLDIMEERSQAKEREKRRD